MLGNPPKLRGARTGGPTEKYQGLPAVPRWARASCKSSAVRLWWLCLLMCCFRHRGKKSLLIRQESRCRSNLHCLNFCSSILCWILLYELDRSLSNVFSQMQNQQLWTCRARLFALLASSSNYMFEWSPAAGLGILSFHFTKSHFTKCDFSCYHCVFHCR